MELPRPSWGALRTLRARELGKILLLTIPLEISTISKGENTGRQVLSELSMTLAAQTGETRVVLDNVSWATFETLLAETGPRRGLLSYEEGTLEIMSPSAEHEILKSAIGRLVEA